MSANLCQIKSGISKFEKKNSFQIQQYLKKKKQKKKQFPNSTVSTPEKLQKFYKNRKRLFSI